MIMFAGARVARASTVATTRRQLTSKPNPTLQNRVDRPRASRRRRRPLPPPPKGAANASASSSNASESDGGGADEWIHSEERTEYLTSRERWVMRVAVVSSLAAIAGFTMNKWEIERRLEQLSPDEQRSWRDGSWVPREQRGADGDGGGGGNGV